MSHKSSNNNHEYLIIKSLFSLVIMIQIHLTLHNHLVSSALSSSSSSSSGSTRLTLETITNSSVVIGSCSRPNIPPMARIRFVSNEKVKFAENETIYIICEENQFPHHVQKRKCYHGHWHGKQARCGRSLVTKINYIEADQCSSKTPSTTSSIFSPSSSTSAPSSYNTSTNQSNQPLLSLNISQSDETPFPLPPNSFHYTRVPETTQLSVIGYDCYRWTLKFEQPVEIQFLLIDINIQKQDVTLKKKDRPKIEVNVKNRICQLEHTSYQVIEQDEIFGNYFFCDLFPNITMKAMKTTNMLPSDSVIKTDELELIVRTDNNRSVGLEAVFIGETYKKLLKHLGNKSNTDCGRLEIERTGVLEQIEMGHVTIACNDSFVVQSDNTRERFICDANGLWNGKFPVCVPKVQCSKQELFDTLNPTIQIEQIGNVYWLNVSEWIPIEHTWIHYTCSNFEGIMVGKSERHCVNGKWTNKVPHCTTAIDSGSITINIIIVILVILIAVFSLIVYLSIRAHGKRINKKLESTKYELEEKALNKQISTSSDGYYSDIGLETIYEDCKEIYTLPEYEISDDHLRYDIDPLKDHAAMMAPHQSTALMVDPAASSSTSAMPLNQQQQQQPQQPPSPPLQPQQPIYEPEYLTMTEGTLNRSKSKNHSVKIRPPQSPPPPLPMKKSKNPIPDTDIYENSA